MPDVFVGTTPIKSAYRGSSLLSAIYRGITKIWPFGGEDYIDGPPATDIDFWVAGVDASKSVVATGIRVEALAAVDVGITANGFQVDEGAIYEVAVASGAGSLAPVIFASDSVGSLIVQNVGVSGNTQFQLPARADKIDFSLSTLFNATIGADFIMRSIRFVKMISARLAGTGVPYALSLDRFRVSTSVTNAATMSVVDGQGVRLTWNSLTNGSMYLIKDFDVVANRGYMVISTIGNVNLIPDDIRVELTGLAAVGGNEFFSGMKAFDQVLHIFTPTASGVGGINMNAPATNPRFLTHKSFLIQELAEIVYKDAARANDLSRWISNSTPNATTKTQMTSNARDGILFTGGNTAGNTASVYIDFANLLIGETYTLSMGMTTDRAGDVKQITWLSGTDAPVWVLPNQKYVVVTQSFVALATTVRMQISTSPPTFTPSFQLNTLGLGRALPAP